MGRGGGGGASKLEVAEARASKAERQAAAAAKEAAAQSKEVAAQKAKSEEAHKLLGRFSLLGELSHVGSGLHPEEQDTSALRKAIVAGDVEAAKVFVGMRRVDAQPLSALFLGVEVFLPVTTCVLARTISPPAPPASSCV